MRGINVQPAGGQRGTNIAGFSGESMELVGVQNHRGIVASAIFAYNTARPGAAPGGQWLFFRRNGKQERRGCAAQTRADTKGRTSARVRAVT